MQNLLVVVTSLVTSTSVAGVGDTPSAADAALLQYEKPLMRVSASSGKEAPTVGLQSDAPLVPHAAFLQGNATAPTRAQSPIPSATATSSVASDGAFMAASTQSEVSIKPHTLASASPPPPPQQTATPAKAQESASIQNSAAEPLMPAQPAIGPSEAVAALAPAALLRIPQSSTADVSGNSTPPSVDAGSQAAAPKAQVVATPTPAPAEVAPKAVNEPPPAVPVVGSTAAPISGAQAASPAANKTLEESPSVPGTSSQQGTAVGALQAPHAGVPPQASRLRLMVALCFAALAACLAPRVAAWAQAYRNGPSFRGRASEVASRRQVYRKSFLASARGRQDAAEETGRHSDGVSASSEGDIDGVHPASISSDGTKASSGSAANLLDTTSPAKEAKINGYRRAGGTPKGGRHLLVNEGA